MTNRVQFRFPEFQIVTVNTNIRYDAPGGIQSRLSEAVLSDCKLDQIALASSGPATFRNVRLPAATKGAVLVTIGMMADDKSELSAAVCLVTDCADWRNLDRFL